MTPIPSTIFAHNGAHQRSGYRTPFGETGTRKVRLILASLEGIATEQILPHALSLVVLKRTNIAR